MDKIADSLHRLAEPSPADLRYELRFDSLFDIGRAFRFPCDALGLVALETLPVRQRQSLERVLTLVGREYACPQLVALAA